MRELSPLDEHFLGLDTDVTVGHVGWLCTLDVSRGAVDVAALRDQVAARIEELPPLRWRLDQATGGRRRWLEAEPDLTVHVRHAHVAGSGGARALGERASQLMQPRLDRDRPLWELHLLDGFALDRAALLIKLHHALLDGVSAVELWEALLGDAPRPDRPRAWQGSLAGPREADSSMPGWVRGPMPPVPLMRFNAPLCGRRDFAFASLPLAPFDDARRAAGTTLSEAFVAAVAGGLREWLDERGELPEHRPSALLPVSVRAATDTRTFGNRMVQTMVRLPTDVEDPAERLEQARIEMVEARRAAAGNGRPPSPIPGPATNLAVVTLPGSEVPLALAGAPLLTTHPIGLLAGSGLNVVGLTARGNLEIGLYVDREQGEGGWSLLEALLAAIDELSGTLGRYGPSSDSTASRTTRNPG